MTRTAVVTEINSNNILVRNNDYQSAKAATSRRFWGVREREYRTVNPLNLNVCSGDVVEVYLPPGRTVLSAGFTFLLPLIMYPVGYVLAGRIIKGAGEDISFLLGFGFLLAGIPFGALLRKIFVGLSDVPAISKILTKAEVSEKQGDTACSSCKICK